MSKIKVYKASAGSGKTYTLAKEYIKELLLSSSDQNYRHILAVTFTKDATGEMMDRILAELYGLAFETEDSHSFLEELICAINEDNISPGEKQIRKKAHLILQNILHDYSRLNITTIDSFFQKVLRNLARELGKGSKYNLEMNTDKILKNAVHKTIEKANKNKQLLEWLTIYIEQKLNEDKNWRIEQEIYEFSKCIYNEYFQENEQLLRNQLKQNPKIFLQIKNQQEAIKKECFDSLSVIHSKVKQLLEQNNLDSNDFIRKGIPILFFQKLAEGNCQVEINKTILECCTDSSGWTSKTHKRKNDIILLAEKELMQLLNESIGILKTILTSQLITGNLHQLGLIWDISEEIAKENSENNRFMLSDTAMFLNQMIDGSDAPFIYEKISSDIRHVMIDEFQDTSRLQWENFKALLSDIIANDNFSLIVGDVKQSIYRWRNGDWRILNNIGNELQCSPETLKFNYRSEENIVRFNNSFFLSSAALLEKQCKSMFSHSSDSFFTTAYNENDVSQTPTKKIKKGYVSIQFVPDKQEDISYPELMKEKVLFQLQMCYEKGISPHDICILTRKNKDIITLADYLSSCKKDYPLLEENNYLNIISNEAFQFQSAPAIKIIIETLKVIAEPENNIYKEQLHYYLQVFNLELPRDFFSKLKEVSFIPLFELIGYLYRTFHLEKIERQSAYLFAFYDAVNKYMSEKPADLINFLQYWEEELKSKTIPTGTSISGIQAMTIHKSKGLQFHTVIIPYCDWNINPKTGTTLWTGSKKDFYSLALLPINYTSRMANTIFSNEYQEETTQSWLDNLNIIYVAFTRAEHNLIILSKYKKSFSNGDKISTIADLLYLCIKSLTGQWEEEEHLFTLGTLDNSGKKEQTTSDNPFRSTLDTMEVTFFSSNFNSERPIFKQSNKSREFIEGENSIKDVYVSYGNIMHSMFEKIITLNDIEKNIDSFISEGLIHPEEKNFYFEKIHSAITESQTNHWFDNKYKTYPEFSIITEENGEVISKRPDRVLFSEQETIIIDYKFGKANKSHHKQVQTYIQLLKEMNYRNVKGYLWYVEERKVVEVTTDTSKIND